MSADRKMGHVQGFNIYIGVFLSLVVLTGLTYAASDMDFGSHLANELVAMGIAGVKATLVTLFFMHARYEGKGTWAFIIYPGVVLFLLLGGLLLDYTASHGKRFSKTEIPIAPRASEIEAHGAGHGDTGHAGETSEHPAAAPHGDAEAHGNAAEPGADAEHAPAEDAATPADNGSGDH